MDEFIELMRAKESWLMERILGYARMHDYTRYSSTLLEAWRVSIAGLTEALAGTLKFHGDGSLNVSLHTDWNEDPASRFAMGQARRHRQRGVSLEMFLGLFVYYRRTYRDLIREFVAEGDDQSRLDELVIVLFDRMSIGFSAEWANVGGQTTLVEMASTLRCITNEKNRYLTFFESLSTPAIFLEPDGTIGNINSAATSLLDSDARIGKIYYATAEDEISPAFLGRKVEAVFPWLEVFGGEVLASVERTFEADVTQPLPFGSRQFRAILNRHPDVSGRITGFSLILHDLTERVRVQEQIRNAKEELDRTFNAISDLVFLVDNDLALMRVNKALETRLSCPSIEIIGRPCAEVLGAFEYNFSGDDRSDGRIPVNFGNIQGSFLVNRDQIRGPDGAKIATVFVARDVTVLESIRGTLLEVEDKYKNIFDNAPVGIFQISPYGFLSVNQALASIFDFDSTEEMRRYYTDIPSQLYVRSEDREDLLREALVTGIVRDRDIELRRKDGISFWAKINGRVIFADDGEAEYFEGFLQDVTELRSSVDRLVKSERQFRGLAETMQQGLVEIDAHGRVTFCNRHFCELVRQEKDEISGLQLVTLVHPDDRETYLRMVDTVGCGEEIRRCDIRWFISGEQFFSIVTPVMQEENKEECAGIWLLVMDVTQRRFIEAQLLQTQKMEAIGQLAAGIAHEINTPTQYVLNYIWFIKEAMDHIAQALGGHGLLFERLASDPALEREIKVIQARDEELQVSFYLEELPSAVGDVLHGLEKITAIVGSVRQFVHPGHDCKTDVDLNKLVTDTVTLSRNEWKYVAELSMDLDPELPPVPCLSQEIGQVLLNLLVNAAHAISEIRSDGGAPLGTIHVITRRDGGWVEIRIADNGSGMPSHVQEHAFEPFFTTKAVGTGTGQGLFIAHRIVTGVHEGTISFKSQPGEGTTFTIRLPLNNTD
ncbi:PAS domain S-box-containing protein [Desulfomicrobium apsheronum]|uniref:histidine kinase n=1 Tax=Desulfomicrobium apsheronum TaxID=52560 RepID=A0A1I3UX27_9BACT|nr:PAS domain S-box protein [Desulfomicrobium apsheronum]SFJ86646.1 PAS domain S-box-containing protein [Desulfomicrobium apsheronum]